MRTRIIRFFVLIVAFLLVACSERTFEKDETVAILNGNEIKVEDLLLYTSLEENAEEIILSHLKLKVVAEEAKSMGMTVTEEELDEAKQGIYPGSTPQERYEMLPSTEFYEQQAAILGLSTEEYYEIWEDKTQTISAYLGKYIYYKFGDINDSETEEEVKEWEDKANKHLNELFELYKKEGMLETNF
ncbi:hypothetical protein [Evansella cellulosilytica]|uniref:Uncharacterized protein n=1 Tax=Evansella cellulosilytica (strain ATCC 21833 / DSM 2522 / FERM P-1141 / JCM 9156 / N-4) TaxID=649639 RepID=E6TWJ0_EVAC2|nr:hypothetical protein [Evansella cellulosilytica]ADU32253.1 hypothetical protein Bcell_4022 [Evansella cellulosilytica DSM 2522]